MKGSTGSFLQKNKNKKAASFIYMYNIDWYSLRSKSSNKPKRKQNGSANNAKALIIKFA